MTKRLLIISLILTPLYLFRLSLVPEYNIPEQTLVKLIGRISKQPYHKGSYQVISVGSVMIRTGRFPGYFYGQKLEVIGKLEKKVINSFLTEYFAFYPAIRVVDEEKNLNQVTNFQRILFNIRGRLEMVVNQLLPEPQSSLLNGILLGAKKEMPQNFWQNLRETGTLHIVVASGYNITVVAGVLISVLTLVVSRKKALAFALLGIVLYTLMVGAELPAVRAAIMAGLAFTAQALGRLEDALIALILAAALMLLISPLILFDIGFQLSFAATAGILFLAPILKEKGGIFNLPIFGNDLMTTLSAQIGVMPIILTNFGTISFLSPLINALVLPVVPLIMNLGAITVFLGLFLRPLGQILSWFVWVLLTYFVRTVEFAGNLPWASFEVGRLSIWWAIGYYFALGIVLFRFNYRQRSP